MGEKPWHDREWLVNKYHREQMSFEGLAKHAGVSVSTIQYWMDKHNIERRSQGFRPSDYTRPPPKTPASLVQDRRGYERWYNQYQGETYTCYVHQLLAIADGYDPYDVFDPETEIHHLNGLKWDNRPININLLHRDEHQHIHREDYVSPWVD